MKQFKDYKIGTKLNVVMISVFVFIMASLALYLNYTLRLQLEEEADMELSERTKDLENIINREIDQNQSLVNASMLYAEEYFKNLGAIHVRQDEVVTIQAENQITRKTHPVHLPIWTKNKEQVQLNYSIVDTIQEKNGGTATIFQRIPEGYLRVSTNVLRTDSSRAVGTYIPNESPVAKSISAGKPYYGRAYVVNDWYLTAYRPIFINNKVEGILYVGVKEKNMEGLRHVFKQEKYYNSGYPFIVDKTGTFIIHPTKEGENFAEAEFFQQLLASSSKEGKSTYTWEGKKKYQYYRYIDRIESFVSVSVYEDEFFNAIYIFRKAVIIAFALGVLLFLIVTTIYSKQLTQLLLRCTNFAKSLADGNLSVSIDIDQKDEVGQLIGSLNLMASQLNETITEIKKHRNNLESLVQEKTEEMAIINDELVVTNKELNDKNNIIKDKNNELLKTIERLKATQVQLTQADKMASLGTLTAGVAHEINNPLNFLMGASVGLTNIFEEGAFDQTEDIGILIESLNIGIERISGIVKGLNQFSRNNENLDEDCDIHTIIDNSMLMLENKIKHKAEIVKDYTQEPVKLKGNVGKMHQVFLNLLTNSIHAITDKGQIKVTTRVINKKILIEIIDNGCGIEEKHINQITDPFFTTKPPGMGTGLGLSITYSIVKEHNGSIECESLVGAGTKIIVTLPAQ